MDIQRHTINAVGMCEIAQFLLENHKKPSIASDTSCLGAWATDAETSLSECGVALIEIRGMDSVTGRPECFTVSPSGIDTETVTVDDGYNSP